MKSNPTFLVLFAATVWSQFSFGQGFVNLDFEQANVAPTPPNANINLNTVDPLLAFPGWSLGESTNNYPLYILYNTPTLDSTALILVGPEFPNPLNLTPIQGSYSVILRYSQFFQSSPFLSQTGLVPNDAKSISLNIAQSPIGPHITDLSLNGLSIPLFQQSNGRFAGDVSAFAGEIATLKISGGGYIDDIVFSTSVVPEPATSILLAPGIFLTSLWIRRQKLSALSLHLRNK